MRKLRILVDMDDTIENFCETLVFMLNERFGLSVKPEDVIEWDLKKAFPTLTASDIFAPTNEAEFWKRVKPLPGAVEFLKQIHKDGHDIVIVTASNPESVPLKLNHMLFRFFPFISRKNVIIASRKDLIRGDVLIDDAPHNLENFIGDKILMTANHNKNYQEANIGATRADNWTDIYLFVSVLATIGKEE